MKDVIIIGGSAAGTAAAIYLARRRLDISVICKEWGGEVVRSGEIENYPGFAHTDGIDLSQRFREQLNKYQVHIAEPLWVEKITKNPDGDFVISIDDNGQKLTELGKAVIITTGVHPRLLNIPGENEYRGKGITYCTVCDGPLFKGKTVAVVGGGNSALEAAIMLASLCPKVYVLTINQQMEGEQILIDKLKAASNVEIITQAQTQKILGNQFVSGIEYLDKKTGNKNKLEIQGIFVHVGFIPNSDLVDETLVKKNKFGNIVVDMEGKTKTAGLFAAGDVIDFPHHQIVIAAGQGAAAALTCINYLNSKK